RAAEALRGAETVDVGGGLLLPAELADAFASVKPLEPDAIALLPKWDAYTMGYAPDGRQRFVDDAHLRLAYSTAKMGAGATSGDGNPLVLRGGHAVAAWSHRFSGDRMTVTVTPFEPGAANSLPRDGLFDEIGQLLGAKSITVTIG
ncbi:MAG TPA: crosslink repair DNA glycosylase YcaQ family protein, partial [Longimicrobium sp.]|nr:crosslink repair DNA glycosylase YcaQ family protein [Longimicrobium sp.]